MPFFCYNKGTKERQQQKMLVSFKKHGENTDGHIRDSRGKSASSRRDTAQEKAVGRRQKMERRVRKAMIPSQSEAST